MASVYVCDVIGTGERGDPFRAEVADLISGNGWYAALMVDEAKAKAMVVTNVDGLQGTGGVALVFQANGSRSEMIAAAKATNITAQRRTAMNNWLSNNGYPNLPGGAQTYFQAIRTAARYVNDVSDLDQTGVG